MIYTCIECENLYDDTDGDLDERMCNRCIDQIYEEKEAAWTSYLAEMNNFVDTTQPYSRADWEQKGNPIASADVGYQKLRFIKWIKGG